MNGLEPLDIYVLRSKRGKGEGYSRDLDLARVEINGQSILHGVKSVTFNSTLNELDTVTITLVGRIAVEQDCPETI